MLPSPIPPCAFIAGDKIVSLIANENHLYAGVVRTVHTPSPPAWQWQLTIVFEDDDVRRVPAHWVLADRRSVVADDGAIRVSQETIVMRPEQPPAEWPSRSEAVNVAALRRVRCLSFHSSLHLHQSAVLLNGVPIPHRSGSDARVPIDTVADDPLAVVQGGIFRRDVLMYEVHQCMALALPLCLGGSIVDESSSSSSSSSPPLRLAFLGGGAGTAPMAVASCFASACPTIDVVEIDGGVMAVATAHFGLAASATLRLHVADAAAWLAAAPANAFDVILMDCAPADADSEAPIEAPLPVFISKDFLNGDVRRTLRAPPPLAEVENGGAGGKGSSRSSRREGGSYVANIIANDADALLNAIRTMGECFDDVRILNIDPNTIVWGLTMSGGGIESDGHDDGAAVSQRALCDAARQTAVAAQRVAGCELRAVVARASTCAAAAAAEAATEACAAATHISSSAARRAAATGTIVAVAAAATTIKAVDSPKIVAALREHARVRQAWVSSIACRDAARTNFSSAVASYAATSEQLCGGNSSSSKGGSRVGRAELVARIRDDPVAARLTRDITMLYLERGAFESNLNKYQAFGWFGAREFAILADARDEFGEHLFES